MNIPDPYYVKINKKKREIFNKVQKKKITTTK